MKKQKLSYKDLLEFVPEGVYNLFLQKRCIAPHVAPYVQTFYCPYLKKKALFAVFDFGCEMAHDQPTSHFIITYKCLTSKSVVKLDFYSFS